MRTIIIEDEKQAINALKKELQDNCPEVDIIGTAPTVTKAVELIEKTNPELVFLDIQLRDSTGFELLERLGHYNFKVIFTTAYSNYAIKAIKVSAIDYLLKPINSDELVASVNKARQIKLEHMDSQIKSLLENRSNDPLRHKIALPSSTGIDLCNAVDIKRIQSEGNYSAVYLVSGKKILLARTLKEFDELLQSSGFLRIHHSHIINLHHLKSYISKDGGYVVLSDNSTFPVSKRKRSELLRVLSN